MGTWVLTRQDILWTPAMSIFMSKIIVIFLHLVSRGMMNCVT
jgi:hypothetical protein